MIASRTSFAFLLLSGALVGCNVHDNTINVPNATLNVTADTDVNNVEPEQSVPMTVNVQNVYLIEPTEMPPPEHVADACHLQFHLDDEANPPILVTAKTSVMVKIPAMTPAGHHKVICRVHKHDGTPTTTKFEVDITVKASITTGGSGGSGGGTGGASGGTGGAGVDTGVPYDAGVTPDVSAIDVGLPG